MGMSTTEACATTILVQNVYSRIFRYAVVMTMMDVIALHCIQGPCFSSFGSSAFVGITHGKQEVVSEISMQNPFCGCRTNFQDTKKILETTN